MRRTPDYSDPQNAPDFWDKEIGRWIDWRHDTRDEPVEMVTLIDQDGVVTHVVAYDWDHRGEL